MSSAQDYGAVQDADAAVSPRESQDAEAVAAGDDANATILPKVLRGRGFAVISIVTFFVYFCAAGAGGYGASKFFNHLNFADFHPEDGSVLWMTNRFLHWGYSGHFWLTPEYILVQSDPPGQPLNEGLRAAEMWGFSDYLHGLITGPGSEWSWAVNMIRSYYLPGYQNETLVGGQNNDTMVIAINYADMSMKHIFNEYQSAVMAYFTGAESLVKLDYKVKLSGIPQMNDAMGKHVLPNMAFIDAIAIPSGLAMFCWATRSPFAVLVPLVVIICSITTSLGFGEVLKQNMKVTGFAPELMATAVIALSIDFSLFVVSRLREFHQDAHVRARFTPPEILWMAYSHTAHNIFISGIAIAAAFGGLAFIKTDFVRSIALLCMIGALMTLLAALTLIPCILYFIYPFCFDNCITRAFFAWLNRRRASSSGPAPDNASEAGVSRQQLTESDAPTERSRADNGSHLDGDYQPQTTAASGKADSRITSKEDPMGPPSSPMIAVEVEDSVSRAHGHTHPHVQYHPSMSLSLWGRAARWSSARPYIVLPAALALLIFPLYNVCAYFRYDDSFYSSSPYTVDGWRNYAETLAMFEHWVDTPITLFMSTETAPWDWNNRGMVLTEANWPFFMHSVDAIVRSDLPVSLRAIDAPCVFEERIINFTEATYLVNASQYVPGNETRIPQYPEEDVQRGQRFAELLKYVTYMDQLSYQFQQMPPWPETSRVSFRLRMPGSTWGKYGAEYLTQFEDTLNAKILPVQDRMAPNVGFVGYNGANANSWAVMKKVMKQFPLEIGITAGMLILAILVLFRSVFFALKMLLTMAYTVTFTFGFVIMVYHYGWFEGAWFALKEVDKYFWLIIVIGFSVACVLSLDYDVFLIIRILDFRVQHRFTDRQSTVHAVSRSGPVISYAALIMMIAFGALIFADTVMMSQFGLTLTIAVFLDAFVVRPLIVPALIAIVPSRALWWPRRVPEPAFDDAAIDEDPVDEQDKRLLADDADE